MARKYPTINPKMLESGHCLQVEINVNLLARRIKRSNKSSRKRKAPIIRMETRERPWRNADFGKSAFEIYSFFPFNLLFLRDAEVMRLKQKKAEEKPKQWRVDATLQAPKIWIQYPPLFISVYSVGREIFNNDVNNNNLTWKLFRK